MTHYEKHREIIAKAIQASSERKYWAAYPESPRAYDESGDAQAKEWFSKQLNQNFSELKQNGETWVGEEISPYLQLGIGVKYPAASVNTLITQAQQAWTSWAMTSPQNRAGILVECLEAIRNRFFDIAYSTMHTTGQSFLMSFQASGPHANDRAMESIAEGLKQLSAIPYAVEWTKPMGKFDLVMHKTFNPIPKGIGLVVGCSTFPVWNTLPGVFANLITGNPTIIKPHPKAVLPIAVAVAEMQTVLQQAGINPLIVQLAPDTTAAPITKSLAEHAAIRLIDFTGSTAFGTYLESIPGKIAFTEKAGVNTVLLESVTDIKATAANIAFSIALYSGQMCTAPQTIFVPRTGINTPEGLVSVADFEAALVEAINALTDNPKAGPFVFGGVQSEATWQRVKEATKMGGKVILESRSVPHPEFPDARVASPVVLEVDASQHALFGDECFGPIAMVVLTDSTDQSLALSRELAQTKGALTCLAYATDDARKEAIAFAMNTAFVPVSFNLTGAGFVNQHAAFSDFHGTGANPAGNASYTDSNFISQRFAWVGNREMR